MYITIFYPEEFFLLYTYNNLIMFIPKLSLLLNSLICLSLFDLCNRSFFHSIMRKKIMKDCHLTFTVDILVI